MKKITISLLCMLFAVSSFAQMVGTGSINTAQDISKSESSSKQKNFGSYDLGIGFVSEDVKSYNLDLIGLAFHLGNDFYLRAHYGLMYIYSKSEESSYGTTYTSKFSTFCMPLRFDLGYRILANEKMAIEPFAGINFNSVISSTLKISYAGEEESADIFEDDFNVGIDFAVGVRFDMKKVGLYGKYHMPLNDTQEIITGEDGYFELGLSFIL